MTSGHDSPEGPAFHRDGSLFFVNWLSSSILRLSPAAPGGTVAEFANTGGIPAGLAFHPDGTLYVAHHNLGRVDVFGPTGRERDRIVLPGAPGAPAAGVTNVAFGGRGGRDLVITDVTTASVYRTRVDLPGLPLYAATGRPT